MLTRDLFAVANLVYKLVWRRGRRCACSDSRQPKWELVRSGQICGVQTRLHLHRLFAHCPVLL